jgi:hypothetical protein
VWQTTHSSSDYAKLANNLLAGGISPAVLSSVAKLNTIEIIINNILVNTIAEINKRERSNDFMVPYFPWKACDIGGEY